MHMKFEWDANKSDANKLKHGIDFKTAKNIWFDEDRIEIQVPYPVEERWIVIGKYKNKIWTGIYTIRNDAIRIISVRRARPREVKLYEKDKIS